MENISLLAAKSQIEGLQMLVEKYERKAENAMTETAASRYWVWLRVTADASANFGGLSLKKELAIVGKEVAAC